MRILICQCCGLPFSSKIRGTNRDLSLSSDYCYDCYRNGSFTNHHITVVDMEKKLQNMVRTNDGVTFEEAQQIICTLPNLKRWKMTHIL
ncbi:zinc ribbon domain-containing protein [Salinimicrobium oceani]|uniref:Putative zinc ribbon domain-containing protein n=1 Tax=Salinimicrobium oceani TaxID=2722702 RepID=A0ABX1CW78_9FLAO|nr:zinc ribbon domain-containing protein [Salinimicrobium oceani]NJW52527.1 hypothetical protein [Salinimicrobium oceani]